MFLILIPWNKLISDTFYLLFHGIKTNYAVDKIPLIPP
jgi:hypothetical protein